MQKVTAQSQAIPPARKRPVISDDQKPNTPKRKLDLKGAVSGRLTLDDDALSRFRDDSSRQETKIHQKRQRRRRNSHRQNQTSYSEGRQNEEEQGAYNQCTRGQNQHPPGQVRVQPLPIKTLNCTIFIFWTVDWWYFDSQCIYVLIAGREKEERPSSRWTVWAGQRCLWSKSNPTHDVRG